MPKRQFVASFLKQVPPLKDVDTNRQRSDWATWRIVNTAVMTYAGILKIDFDPGVVGRTVRVARSMLEWLTLEGLPNPDHNLANVRAAKVASSQADTGEIGPPIPGRSRTAAALVSLLKRAHAKVQRPRYAGPFNVQESIIERQTEVDGYMRELELHRVTPIPEFVDPDARLVVAAALACQAVLSHDKGAQLEAAEVLVTDFSDAVQVLAGPDAQ